jgi:hypothetical protein
MPVVNAKAWARIGKFLFMREGCQNQLGAAVTAITL